MPNVLPTTIHQTEAPDKLEYVVASAALGGLEVSVVVESGGTVEPVFESAGPMVSSVVPKSRRLAPLSMG